MIIYNSQKMRWILLIQFHPADISDLNFKGITALFGVLPQPKAHIREQIKNNPITHKEKDQNLVRLSDKISDGPDYP